jgi:hypothetical protein
MAGFSIDSSFGGSVVSASAEGLLFGKSNAAQTSSADIPRVELKFLPEQSTDALDLLLPDRERQRSTAAALRCLWRDHDDGYSSNKM